MHARIEKRISRVPAHATPYMHVLRLVPVECRFKWTRAGEVYQRRYNNTVPTDTQRACTATMHSYHIVQPLPVSLTNRHTEYCYHGLVLGGENILFFLLDNYYLIID